MEVLFENSHIRDKQFFKELTVYMAFKRKPAIFIHIVVLLEMILTIALSKYAFFGVAIGIEAFWLVVHFLNCYKRAIDREVETSGNKQIVYTVTITADEKITQASTKGTMLDFDFSMFKYSIETKGYMFLCSKANQLLAFKKDSFSKGTFDEFLSLLKNKGL